MSRSIAKPALAVSLLAACTSGVFAETLGGPPDIDSGSYNCPPASGDSYTFYEPDGSNYSCSNSVLPGVLQTALAGDSADPSGYVKLLPFIAAGAPIGPICIDGTFPTTGDTLEVCSPAPGDWTTLVDDETLARTYFDAFFNNNPGLYEDVAAQYRACLEEMDPAAIEADIFDDFTEGLPLFSNPAISYIDQAANGAVSIGLAQAFDATPAYAQALKFAFTAKICAPGFNLDLSVLQGFQLQFTEAVKITFNDEEPFFAYSFEGGQTGRFQDDRSCIANLALYNEVNGAPDPSELEAIKLQICSGSGNYEIGFNEPTPPGPPAPVPAVSGMGLALSALGLAVMGWRRVGRRAQR